MEEQRVFSVTEVNGYIKNLIDGTPMLNGLLIRGELSNYKIKPTPQLMGENDSIIGKRNPD